MTAPGDIAGDTTAGAAVGETIGVHLNPHLPPSPSGSDVKSIAIETALNTFLVSARAEIHTFNGSVDSLRRGMAYAPNAIERTDQTGAAAVATSGRMAI